MAIDPDTKAVPCFRVGKRNFATTTLFIEDLEGRLKNRIQLSSDGLKHYRSAVEATFGTEVDYGQIVKSFSQSDVEKQKRYSPANLVSIQRNTVIGKPDESKICTSYIEKQNHTLRMHCRRLTRLTNAFSKKLDNFKAAVALHYGYYNFVKIHKSIRCTPAMEAGVTDSVWTVGDLVEMI